MCQLQDFDRLKLSDDHRATVNLELDLWHRAYLPVKGTVLDIGAGCGETAFFYLNHGADRVICIECDQTALEYLRENFQKDSRVTIIDARIDDIKIDIEGGEKDMVFETHYPVKFRKMWKAPSPARDVNLWRLETNRRTENFRRLQDRMHQYRINAAHRVRLILERVS
jgi:SAM-dependent methyltransferase